MPLRELSWVRVHFGQRIFLMSSEQSCCSNLQLDSTPTLSYLLVHDSRYVVWGPHPVSCRALAFGLPAGSFVRRAKHGVRAALTKHCTHSTHMSDDDLDPLAEYTLADVTRSISLPSRAECYLITLTLLGVAALAVGASYHPVGELEVMVS